MNRKGQITIGVFIMLFVGIIVATSLITGGISNNVGAVTQTTSLSNAVYTAGAVGSYVDLPYQALKGTITITNTTSGTLIPASNYTITNYVVSNGQLVTRITSLAGAIGFQGKNVNVTATVVEPFGYDTTVGGRAMSSMIMVFAALALAVATLSIVFKEKLIDVFG